MGLGGGPFGAYRRRRRVFSSLSCAPQHGSPAGLAAGLQPPGAPRMAGVWGFGGGLPRADGPPAPSRLPLCPEPYLARNSRAAGPWVWGKEREKRGKAACGAKPLPPGPVSTNYHLPPKSAEARFRPAPCLRQAAPWRQATRAFGAAATASVAFRCWAVALLLVGSVRVTIFLGASPPHPHILVPHP